MELCHFIEDVESPLRFATRSYWHRGKACSTLRLLSSKLGDKSAVRPTGLTNNDRKSSHSRETAATGQRGQRQEALPEAGIPLRTGIRDAGSGLRQDRHERHVSRPEQKKFVTLENTTRASRSRWSAQRSALVADVLRRSGRLRVRLQVHGESMLPALWPGDVVEIESCPPEEVWPGEIVLAQRDAPLFLPRPLPPPNPCRFPFRA